MERISSRQITLMGCGYVLDATLISVPAQMIGSARQDAWLAYLPSLALMIGVLWMLGRVANRFPDEDLFASMIRRYPLFGRIGALLLVTYFFFILSRDFRSLVDFINITTLPNTPLIVLAIMTVITVIQIARGGVEVVARMTELFVVVLIALIVLLPLMVFKDFEIRFFRPFLENGIKGPLQGSWYSLPYLGEIVGVSLIFPNRTYKFKYGLYGLLMGTGLLEVLIVLNTMVLGNYLSSISVYPNLEMVRQIRVTDFLDRFDLPIGSVWVASMFVKLSISLHIVTHGLKRLFPSAISAQFLVSPVGLLACVCSLLLFQNTIQLLNFNRDLPVLAIAIEIGLPVLMFLFLRPKKKKQKGKPEAKAGQKAS